MNYRIAPPGNEKRADFSSGSPALDRYFREQVGQDIRRRVTSCFVALDDAGTIAGFYTLAMTSISPEALPDEHRRKLPRYPTVPAALMGRLAVDRSHQGEGLGGALVADALMRAIRSDLAAYALLVDAKDETAVRFYERLGFERLVGTLRLFHTLAALG
ncbi:MAG: GNAT family N-acetyltransferase [Proteobacteria bacterium]|nr:GNAT family N-acetyltransferase [Pseudomonadota bacterium]